MLGSQKASIRQSKNSLLQKDDIGKSKPSVRDLPHPMHSYGLIGARDNEGVDKLTSKWN